MSLTSKAAANVSKTADIKADLLSDELADLSAGDRIKYLYENFGSRVVASTSFGLQAPTMLHLIRENAPEIPIIFVDTGYCFPETYQFAQSFIDNWGLDIRIVNPSMTSARQEALYGKLWEQGEVGMKKYALLNKVEPMNRALSDIGADIWVSGIRRSQSSTRADRPFAEQQRNTLKVYPILDWADPQVSGYFYDHQLPKHPLEAEGYVTMGDWHSTRPPEHGEDAEATRFGGEKYECGLHEGSSQNDFQI